MQQATVNLLSDMGVTPATPQTDVVVTGPSTDTVAPTVSITAPTGGSTVPAGTVTVQGTAADVGGAVGAVEVSTDARRLVAPGRGLDELVLLVRHRRRRARPGRCWCGPSTTASTWARRRR